MTGMPMVLDDRLISKQYIKAKVDGKVDDTAYGSSWNYIEGTNNNNEVAPSKNAVYDYLNSLAPSSDMWTREEDTADTNVRTYKTGNYGIGKTTFTGADAWAKLDVTGSISATGDYIMATNGSKIGPSSGELTLHSTNGALLPTNFMIGTGNANVPLEISKAGSTPTKADGTGIIQAGADGGANLGIGADKIQARDGSGGAAELKLNTTAGAVSIGSSTGTTTINGDLVVEGTATTTLSEEVLIEDSDIVLNSNLTGEAPAIDADAGIRVNRGTSNPARIIWDEGDDKWSLSDGTNPAYEITHSTHAPLTLGTNTDNALSLSGQELSLADKFVQLNGDTMTGALTIGSASSGAVTNLTVWGDDDSDPDNSTVPALVIKGIMESSAKAFNIEHPSKKGMRLVHGCLEGPEFGMYQRGTIKSVHQLEEIPLPEYWKAMVGDYTVLLTPHGNYNVWLEEKNKTMFKIKSSADAIDGPWKCEWIAIGRRTDQLLEVEQDANK